MKVLDLLEEIIEVCDTASGVPLTNKIMVDKAELLEIVDDIRKAMPEEIQQAQFIRTERDRILNEAKEEYDRIIKDAEQRADILVEQNEITTRAKAHAKEITEQVEANVKHLKLSTYDYVDKVLFDFQGKVDQLQHAYLGEMYTNIQNTFEEIGESLSDNRDEIKKLAYKLQVDE
jgi:vacuolar-type H+-ATPase subunit H